MSQIKILDCTLRDGGYINDFYFGKRNITAMIDNLTRSGIEIIECGFLKSGAVNPDRSLFAKVDTISQHLQNRSDDILYVAMIAMGDISAEEISPCDSTSITGIRVTFHEHEIEQAFALGRDLQNKGYTVFMQPVGTTSYNDISLLKLVEKINQMKPFAFYLVDTLGTMYKNDLLRMFHLVDHNLDPEIAIGYHSHNNLQLAFSNAQELFQINSKRDIIIDSSVFGMGRGAGNLCTELIAQYINDNVARRYDVIPLLEIVDEQLNSIFAQYPWGYSVPYFIASSHQCHPNYATFLINKQTLSVKDIHKILKSMEESKRTLYDHDYINDLYLAYQKHNIDDYKALANLKNLINGRQVLVIAPGASIDVHQEQIITASQNDATMTISINFNPEFVPVDALFVSNLKRFKLLDEQAQLETFDKPVIATSNLVTEAREKTYIINYSDYLNDEPSIADNAGLMLLNLLQKLGVQSIILAGFDGFNIGSRDYYRDSSFSSLKADEYKNRNRATATRLQEIAQTVRVEFLTPSVYAHA